MRGVLRGLGLLVVLVLLTGAVLLTAARLVDHQGVQWVRARAFTPYALPAYALLLLVALVLAGRRTGGRRLLAGALALVSVAGLGAHVSWFLPQVAGDDPAPGPAAGLVVMTSNQYAGAGDAAATVRAAVEAGADVLVVQELTPGALAEMERAGLDEAFGERAGRLEGEYSTLVFSRRALGEPAEVAGTSSSVAVPVRVGGAEVLLVAAHLAPPVDAARWRREHAALEEWVGRHRPDLVAGDLNATVDHLPLRRLAAAGYRSVTDRADEGWRPTWPADREVLGVVPLPPLVQIDHVLVGPRLAASGSRTVEVPGSDHRALVARVGLR